MRKINKSKKGGFLSFLLHGGHSKAVLVSLFILAINSNCLFGQAEPQNGRRDSLKIYFVGQFKNETFRIYQDSFVYEVKMSRKGAAISSFSTFRIHIALPDSINQGDLMNIVIKRKPKYGFFYRNTKTYFQYRDDLKYLIVWRSFRYKNRYPIDYEWNCKPPLINIPKSFWEKDGDTKNVIKTKNKKGSIDAKEVIRKDYLR